MVETLNYSQLYTDDLDLGVGLRSQRLQNGRMAALKKIDPGYDWAYRTGYLQDYLGKGRSVLISQPVQVDDELTIGEDDDLLFTDGGGLILNAPVTCSGTIRAGRFRIFTGDESITFTAAQEAMPEWWGAVVNDTTVDSGPGIEKALFSFQYGGTVSARAGVYTINSTINYPIIGTGTAFLTADLKGLGYTQTILRRGAGFTGTLLAIGDDSVNLSCGRISNLQFDGIDRAAGTVGIRMQHAHHLAMDRVWFNQFEKCMWVSGGGQNAIYNSFFVGSDYGIIFDNTNDRSCDIQQLFNCRFNNNFVVDIDIDGTHGTSEVREIFCWGTNFDGQSGNQGRTEVRIRRAMNVHFWGAHFEDGDPFVSISDGVTNQPCRFITFDACNFDNVHQDTINNIAFQFEGTASLDGMGCVIRNGRMHTGIFEFNQTFKMAIENIFPNSPVEFQGTQYVLRSPNGNEAVNHEEQPTETHWRYHRLNKEEVTHTTRIYEILATTTLSNNTPAPIATYTVPTDTTIFLEVNVLGVTANQAESASYKLGAILRNNAGTTTVTGGTVVDIMTPIEVDAAWACTITASGANALVQATSDTVAQVRWAGDMKIMQITD